MKKKSLKADEIVRAVCGNCTSCFRDDCPRGEISLYRYPTLPKVGKDTKCSISSMAMAEKMPDERRLSSNDTFKVCSTCTYTKNGEITDECLHEHCMDCACASLRECLQEGEWEARVS